MTQYNSLNVKLSNSKLNKFKTAIKNQTEVVLGIHKKILGSGDATTLIISNDEINDIIKIVKSLEDSGLLLKGVNKTVQNEVKGQKGGFLSILLGTLGASLLGNLLTGKGIYRAGKGKGVIAKSQGRGINRAGEGIVRVGYGNSFSKMGL